MTEIASTQLPAWQSFYVIVGSSGGALIGIQFVVITLVAAMRRRPTSDEVSAFATPTLVHFAGALLASAVMSAPWTSLVPPAVTLAAFGLGGLVYGATGATAIGIHNAWDSVTHIVLVVRPSDDATTSHPPTPPERAQRANGGGSGSRSSGGTEPTQVAGNAETPETRDHTRDPIRRAY